MAIKEQRVAASTKVNLKKLRNKIEIVSKAYLKAEKEIHLALSFSEEILLRVFKNCTKENRNLMLILQGRIRTKLPKSWKRSTQKANFKSKEPQKFRNQEVKNLKSKLQSEVVLLYLEMNHLLMEQIWTIAYFSNNKRTLPFW